MSERESITCLYDSIDSRDLFLQSKFSVSVLELIVDWRNCTRMMTQVMLELQSIEQIIILTRSDYEYLTDNMLVKVDLDIVKNPPPVIGSSLDNFLISYFRFCLWDLSLVLSSFSSVLSSRFWTESQADSTVRVRATKANIWLPDEYLIMRF